MAAEAVRAAMRIQHELSPGDEDDFTVQTQDDIVALRTQTTSTMTTLLAGVAFVSLVVGGIGIMNIMLVSVTERTREIGVRLAIGARMRDIRLQFLLEAITLGIMGGVLGVAIGYFVANALAGALQWPVEISRDGTLIALAIAIGSGILFGYYPAHQAAQLDPIEALRAET